MYRRAEERRRRVGTAPELKEEARCLFIDGAGG